MADDPVVPNPTYMANIRNFFTATDIAHMGSKGIDLSTYASVRASARNIFLHTCGSNPDMPPPSSGEDQWTANRCQTFANWIQTGFPQGTAIPQDGGSTAPVDAGGAADTRVRKNVANLSQDEIETLKQAFNGLMARDPKNPQDPVADNSYFGLAGIHGLPGLYCLHHLDQFNPWHRAYLKIFEDELRTIQGCEDVTLPFWDISTELPAWFADPPFKNYKLPGDPGGGFAGYTTKRNTPSQILANMNAFGVLDDIQVSLQQSVWGLSDINGYQDFSIQAHDGGHGSTGPTMSNQAVASYDPVFWFFHCNLDRLWLKWQGKVGGTTLAGFKSTIHPPGTTTWLTAAPTPLGPANALPPWQAPITTDETIPDVGISYDQQGLPSYEEVGLENKVGSLEAARTFSIKSSSPVSVRVKDIDRLAIPGSFAVHLLADGEPIAKRFFFQGSVPADCSTCREHPLVNIDFRLDQEELRDRKLSVEIHVPDQEEIGTQFPLSKAGDPTVNARLLLDEE